MQNKASKPNDQKNNWKDYVFWGLAIISALLVAFIIIGPHYQETCEEDGSFLDVLCK